MSDGFFAASLMQRITDLTSVNKKQEAELWEARAQSETLRLQLTVDASQSRRPAGSWSEEAISSLERLVTSVLSPGTNVQSNDSLRDGERGLWQGLVALLRNLLARYREASKATSDSQKRKVQQLASFQSQPVDGLPLRAAVRAESEDEVRFSCQSALDGRVGYDFAHALQSSHGGALFDGDSFDSGVHSDAAQDDDFWNVSTSLDESDVHR